VVVSQATSSTPHLYFLPETSADSTAYIRRRTAQWQQARAMGTGGYGSQA
jgi:hypothetical protein